eukprot:Rmarinus@m.28467
MPCHGRADSLVQVKKEALSLSVDEVYNYMNRDGGLLPPISIIDFPEELHLLICSYLTTKDVIQLSLTCKQFRKSITEDFYKQLFVQRWGDEYHLDDSTHFANTFIGLTFTHLYAYSVYFMNAVEVSLAFLPTSVLSLKPSAFVNKPNIRLSSWKLACALKDSTTNEIRRCRICNRLEVFTEAQRKIELDIRYISHGYSTWVSPCACGFLMHRSCLENACLIPNLENEEEADCTSVCEVCSEPYRVGKRFCMSPWELIVVTYKRKSVMWMHLRRIIPRFHFTVLLLLFLENLPHFIVRGCDLIGIPIVSGFDLDSIPWYPVRPWSVVFSWQQVVFLYIYCSDRFARAVRRLWTMNSVTGLYSFFIKLYFLIVFTNFYFIYSYLRLPLFDYSEPFSNSQQLFAFFNAIVYYVASSCIIFIWWKTDYVIPTIMDAKPLRQQISTCWTCGMGMCLDHHHHPLHHDPLVGH